MKMKRWVEFTSNGDSFLLDMEFLLSGYKCSYGAGCPGVQGAPDIGCCIIGTSIYDSELEDVSSRVSQLTPDDWQNHGKKWKKKNNNGNGLKFHTTTVEYEDGVQGCIFANRSDFHGGAGCAFHVAAVSRGENPIDWKPEICWSVPIGLYWARSINAFVIRQTSREDWQQGSSDKDLLEWWCTDDDLSWGNSAPLYQTNAEELEKMLASTFPESKNLYNQLKAICDFYWTKLPTIEPTVVPVTLISRSSKDY